MKEIIGSNQRGIEINLSTQERTIFPISNQDRIEYLGGKGLGIKLLYERLSPDTDPLSAGNLLIFNTGVMLGSGAPCSGRFSLVSKSPLTGLISSSSCGGPFGLALKACGYDALIITGKSRSPVSIEISEAEVRIKNADHLWGLDTIESQHCLSLGNHDGALVIGPAGEHLVRFANIRSGHRFFGRGGFGAVMGSKNIKAIIARGAPLKVVPAYPGKFKKTKGASLSRIFTNNFTGDRYPEVGTNANLRLNNQKRILPVRNFSRGSTSEAEEISGENINQRHDTKPSTCQFCPIRCGRKFTTRSGLEVQMPEYETLGLMGPNLEIYDEQAIAGWNHDCGRLGMDTVSTGVILGFLMEANEQELIPSDLEFGKIEGISSFLHDIAYRNGLGNEAAEGVRFLADQFGGTEFAPHVKGLEFPAYDPRGSWGQGLAYAVANRGACHLSATVFPLEAYLEFVNPESIRAKAEFVRFFEDLFCVVNSLQLCIFTAFAFLLEAPIVKYTPRWLLRPFITYLPAIATKFMDAHLFRDLFTSVTGYSLTTKELLEAGERIHVLERYMNTLEGIDRMDDQLPQRFTHQARENDPNQVTVNLDPMLTRYYRIRGFTNNGIPTRSLLRRLSITPNQKQSGHSHVLPDRSARRGL